MQKNAAILHKHGFPVTPTTPYLAHFVGPGALSLFCQHLRMPMRAVFLLLVLVLSQA